jgi:hypothetical protein
MPYRKIQIELVVDEDNADGWLKTMRCVIGEMDKHAPLKRLEVFDEVSEELPGHDPLSSNPVANVHAVECVPEGYEEQYPYKKGEHVLLIEIANMPGHAAVITSRGTVEWAYHTDDFRKLSSEET